ncbi:hypothetical protein EDC16_10567 [Testudinibacter aquarius]|uniref:Uncharacterized protein n=1 Tax=Testudinibacter aquarius TaxID=1524974 RepID=A0A4R3Y5U6_9PAST|nr:hypothetical protein EDC16_10567 [Testudinibacter aquarius]
MFVYILRESAVAHKQKNQAIKKQSLVELYALAEKLL